MEEGRGEGGGQILQALVGSLGKAHSALGLVCCTCLVTMSLCHYFWEWGANGGLLGGSEHQDLVFRVPLAVRCVNWILSLSSTLACSHLLGPVSVS